MMTESRVWDFQSGRNMDILRYLTLLDAMKEFIVWDLTGNPGNLYG